VEILKLINIILLSVSLITTIFATADIFKSIPQKKGLIRNTGVALAMGFSMMTVVLVLSLLAYFIEYGHEVARFRTTALALGVIGFNVAYALMRKGII
jgi:hypothetical protein